MESFSKLKSLVTSLPVLVHYDINNDALVSADASSYGIGSVLLHNVDGKFHPVDFASRSLNSYGAAISKLAHCTSANILFTFFFSLAG